MAKTRLIYWDACVFIAYLNSTKELLEGKRTQDEIDAIDQMIGHLEKGELRIATSVITKSEVLAGKIVDKTIDYFERLFSGRTIELIGADIRIADRAHEIRNYYVEHPVQPGQCTIANFDALHLASALSRRCKTFYTFDNNADPKKPMGLIQISNNIAGGKWRMRISRPTPVEVQSSIAFAEDEDEEDSEDTASGEV